MSSKNFIVDTQAQLGIKRYIENDNSSWFDIQTNQNVIAEVAELTLKGLLRGRASTNYLYPDPYFAQGVEGPLPALFAEKADSRIPYINKRAEFMPFQSPGPNVMQDPTGGKALDYKPNSDWQTELGVVFNPGSKKDYNLYLNAWDEMNVSNTYNLHSRLQQEIGGLTSAYLDHSIV